MLTIRSRQRRQPSTMTFDTSSKTVNGEKINFLNHIENGDWVKYQI